MKTTRGENQNQFDQCNQTNPSPSTYCTRRRVLLSSLTLVGLAGCSSLGQNVPNDEEKTQSPNKYPHLSRSKIYKGPSINLDLPESIEIVDSPDCATLILLDTGTNVQGKKIVEWLRADNAVALVGNNAMDRLLDLLVKGNANKYFDNEIVAGEGTHSVGAVVPIPSEDRLSTLQAGGGGEIEALDDVISGIMEGDTHSSDC